MKGKPVHKEKAGGQKLQKEGKRAASKGKAHDISENFLAPCCPSSGS